MNEINRTSAVLTAAFFAFSTSALAHNEVLSPNGGESFLAGQTVTIEWTVTIEHTLLSWDVLFSATGDQGPFTPIATALPPGDPTVGSEHTFDWVVPAIQTDQGSILVRMNTAGIVYEDTSDTDFAIGVDLGDTGCSGQVSNSTGVASSLSLTGSAVAVENDLTLSVSGLPPGMFGFAINSDTADMVPMAGGAQGNLCLGGVIGRHVAQVMLSDGAGNVSIPIDLTALPRGTGTTAVLSGETWHFQWWHRDEIPQQASNFSDSVALTLQ